MTSKTSFVTSVQEVHTNTHKRGLNYATINPLNTELNPICHLLALLGVRHILHISRIRVNAQRRRPNTR